MGRIAVGITGLPGSGSTTLGKNMAKAVGWPRRPYYSGGVVRYLSKKKEDFGEEEVLKTSVAEITALMEAGEVPDQPKIADAYRDFPPELDLRIDQAQMGLLEKKDFGIHEGRIVWYLIKKLVQEGRARNKTFATILCTINPAVGVWRLLKRPENRGKNVQEMLQETKERLRWEAERYRHLYGIENHWAPENFDIVMDTSVLDEEEAVTQVFQEIERWFKERGKERPDELKPKIARPLADMP